MNLKQEKLTLILLTFVILCYSFISFFNLGTNNFPQTFETFEIEKEIILDLNKEQEVSFLTICNGYNILNYEISYSLNGEEYTHVNTVETEYFYSWEKIDIGQKTRFIKIKPKQYTELPPAYKKSIYDGNIAYINEIGVWDKNEELITYNTDYSNLNDEQNTVQKIKTPVNSLYFDEFYFAKAGYQYSNGIIDGEIDQPPLGKILISLGIKCFGMTPFGWRFPGTLAGVLMIGFLFLLSKELFNSSKCGLLTAILLSLDFMHFSQTRIATIDSFAVLSIIICFYSMIKIFKSKNFMPYVFLAGTMLGIGCAIKIYCAYAIPVLGILLLYKIFTVYQESIVDAVHLLIACILSFFIIPIIINMLSFIPHFKILGITDPLKYMFDYYKNMFMFHSTTISEHPFSSHWWQWLFNYKPILYYGTETDGIYSIIACFNNPLISIVGLCSLIYTAYKGFKNNDFTGKFIILAYLSYFIPWIFINRSTFIYHYFASSIFMLLAIVYMIYNLKNTKHKKLYYIIIFTFLNISTVLFILYYPVLTGYAFNIEYARNFMIFYPFLNF